MTTIAWDGTTLAGDKRATFGSIRTTVTKIRRGPKGNLVGISGTFSLSEPIFDWLLHGAERPEAQGEKNDFCGIIEITPDGRCFKHERHGCFRIEDPFFAVGTGSDFAIAAMALGHSAAEAVALAARFDTNTGDGIDTLGLLPAPPAPVRRRVRR